MSNKLNILVAYPYMKPPVIEILKNNQEHVRFLLDSGAFTAWKSGKPIELDDYCKFIEGLPFKPWRYFTLDKIGDAEGSYKNYEIMLRRGFTPIPIFTRGENILMVDEYYKTSDVLGVGGLVGTSGNKGFVKGIMAKIGDRKAHWLGFTEKNFVAHYKPYMCDSSSWEGGARFGSFSLYAGGGKYISLNRKDFTEKPSLDICKKLKDYDVDVYDLAKESNWHGGRSINRILNARSAVKASLDIEKKLGTKQFCACTTGLALNLLIEGYDKEIKK
jgi:hypothetical protein